MPFAGALGGVGVKMLVATKDVYVAALLIPLFLRNVRAVRWMYVDGAAMLFLGVYVVYGVASPADLFARAVSFREGFMIVAFYLLGRLALLDLRSLRRLLRVVVLVAIATVCFGYWERLFFSAATWQTLGSADYVQAKWGAGVKAATLLADMPREFHTYVGGTLVRRMVGPIGNATSLSRFIAFPILALIYVRGLVAEHRGNASPHLLALLVLGGALVLTFGRGGQFVVVIGILVWLAAKRARFALSVLVPCVVVSVRSLPLFAIHEGPIARHVIGFAKGVDALWQTPLGHGLGTSGQMAILYAKDTTVRVGESYFGSLAYQAGVVGVVAYFLFWITLSWRLWHVFTQSRAGSAHLGPLACTALLALSMAVGISVSSLLANAAISPISAGLPLLYCGVIAGRFPPSAGEP